MMMDYLRSVIHESVSRPSKVPLYVRLELEYILRKINQFYHSHRGKPEGYNLMDEDWDTAIILDSCRYDFFAEEYDSILDDGFLRQVISPGSESREFMVESFKGENFHDTVYVTGNPYVSLLPPDTFHDIKINEAWDDDSTEVPPQRITKTARKAHRKYPNKRVIVHYMTPHLPFVSSEYKELNEEIGEWRGAYWPDNTTRAEIRAGYRENVKVALRETQALLDDITGKIVITADHGEMLGEPMKPIPIRGYDHFPSLYTPELISVPWVEIESPERREIKSESPVNETEIDEEKKEERLRALGYIG